MLKHSQALCEKIMTDPYMEGEYPATPVRSNRYMEDEDPVTPVRSNRISSVFNPPSPTTPAKTLKVKDVSVKSFSRVSVAPDSSSLLIEPNRHMTVHGERQKNHATPHICLSQLLHSLFEDTDINKAGEKIQDIANVFLPDKKHKFTEIMDRYQEEARGIAFGETRKEATQGIRSGIFLAELLSDTKVLEAIALSMPGINIKEVEANRDIIKRNTNSLNMVKPSLKAAEDHLHYKLVAQISDTFLRELNMDDYVAFSKVTESDSQEANRVKYSVYALNSLNKILGLVSIEDLAKLQSEQMADKIADQDLDKIHEQIFLSNSKFKTGLKRLLGLLPKTEETEIALSTFDKEIKVFEGGGCKKELLIFIFKKLKTIDIKGKASELVINLFDFEYLDHKADNDILATLSKVCIRHLAIVNKCFPNIGANPNLKAKLEEDFLENGVLKKSGWENFEARITPTRRSGLHGKKLDLNLLVTKISEISQTEKYCKMAQSLSLDKLVEKAGVKIKKRRLGDDVKRTLDYHEDVGDNPEVLPRPSVKAPIGSSAAVVKRARLYN